MPHEHKMPPPPHFIFGIEPSIFFFNAFLIGFYYLNSFILIPRLLGQRMRFWYIVSIIVCMVLIVLSPGIVSSFFPMHIPPFEMLEHREIMTVRILVTVLLFAIIFIVSTGIRIIREWYASEQKNEQIQLEKTTAELSFLKAQVNPHFLFNTLNNIYGLSVKGSEKTSEAVLLLADMMRYVLSDTQNDYVPLELEINYLSKFIELQKLRITDKVSIDYEVKGDIESKKIAPLILLPFIENAFKFGISTLEQSTIVITIEIDGNNLKMKTINMVFPQTYPIEKSSGIGQINAKKRLSLLYAGKYKLHIDPNNHSHYVVTLEMNLSV